LTKSDTRYVHGPRASLNDDAPAFDPLQSFAPDFRTS
jgi:hypothetical protein